MKPLKIALIHVDDARSVRPNSGTLYFSKQAVHRVIGDVIDLTPAPINVKNYKIASALMRKSTGRKAPYEHNRSLSKRLGRYFTAQLADTDCDLVFSPCSSSTLAYVQTDRPVIYYSDITWRLAHNYYDCYTNVLESAARHADEIERRALQLSSIAAYPSQWAADSAVRDYGVDSRNVHVFYLGANLMNPPLRDDVLPKKLGRTIRLLLVGVNWSIKGGAIALDALKELLAMGYDAELTVVGCRAPEGVSHPKMRVFPFLNKQVPAERELFESFWRESDFFILPSRFEAAGLVLCEASAYALPSIAASTGGIPSIVQHGRNGLVAPHDAGGKTYAELIASVADDPARYEEFCRTSRDEYESRLNWDSWARRLAEAIAGRFPHLGERLRKSEEIYNPPLSRVTD